MDREASNLLKKSIVDLYKTNITQKEISEILGCSTAYVSKTLHKKSENIITARLKDPKHLTWMINEAKRLNINIDDLATAMLIDTIEEDVASFTGYDLAYLNHAAK